MMIKSLIPIIYRKFERKTSTLKESKCNSHVVGNNYHWTDGEGAEVEGGRGKQH